MKQINWQVDNRTRQLSLQGWLSVIWWKMKVKVLVTLSCLTVTPWTIDHQAPPGNFSGKNTGVGCHSFFQGIVPIQVSNPGLPQCRQILYHLSHQGSPDSTVEGPKGHPQELELYLWNRTWPKISEQVMCLKQYRNDMGGKWTHVKARGGGDAHKEGTWLLVGVSICGRMRCQEGLSDISKHIACLLRLISHLFCKNFLDQTLPFLGIENINPQLSMEHFMELKFPIIIVWIPWMQGWWPTHLCIFRSLLWVWFIVKCSKISTPLDR